MAIEPLRGVLLWVAYDGSHFHGMARQPHQRTVAGELEGAIATLDPHATPIRQVSRTDAGVHARGQIVAFDTSMQIPPRGWICALSAELPAEIALISASSVEAGFDPRDHVVSKTYRYRLLQSPVRDPFLERRAWRIHERLNHEHLRKESAALITTANFAAFRASADSRSCTTRTIASAQFSEDSSDSRCLWFEIRGQAFLYHMVRIIVGTLVDVGRGRLPLGTIASALASCRRSDLGVTAPPDGLFLDHVELDQQGKDRWP